jgi:outer membrane protein TolC
MTFLLYTPLLIVALGGPIVSAQTLTLDDVVSRAVNRANERQAARVSAAVANERYLESQSKFHFELRPRIGLLAFSHPALLATSLGSGILLGQNPPSPWARQNARLDAIAAEIGAERAIMLAEREALRQYFGLMRQQKATDEIRELAEQRRARLRSVDEKVRFASATAIDSAVLELGLITLDTQLEDAETQQRIAASALGELLGAREGEDIRVADLALPERIGEVPSTQLLFSAAMRRGDSRVALRKKLEAERDRIFREGPVHITPLSASYAHIGDHSYPGVGLAQSGFVFGDHTGSLDVGLRISPWRAGAENAALATAANARIRALEFELAELDDSVRLNLDTLRLLVVSARRKAELAARKLELADRTRRLISLRQQSGLEGSQAVITADADVSRARAELHGAESDRNTAWTHLLIASGLRGTGTAAQKAVPLQPSSGKPTNSGAKGLQ